MEGDNGNLQNKLFQDHGVLMIALSPYWYKLNPTELVFQMLLARMKSERARYNTLSDDIIYDNIMNEMLNFSFDDVTSFYTKCGYYY